MEKVLILDRDGTLIVEKNYLHDPEQVELIPGSAEALSELSNQGYHFFVLTNQSGVGRGYFTLEQVESVHSKIDQLLLEYKVKIEKYYIAPESPTEPSTRRKPETGMLLEAAAEFGFIPSSVIVIGDKPADIELGKRVGAKTVLVLSGYGKESQTQCQPDHVIEDLSKILAII